MLTQGCVSHYRWPISVWEDASGYHDQSPRLLLTCTEQRIPTQGTFFPTAQPHGPSGRALVSPVIAAQGQPTRGQEEPGSMPTIAPQGQPRVCVWGARLYAHHFPMGLAN